MKGSFRDFVAHLKKTGKLVELKKTTSLKLELAGVMAALDGKPVYTDKIKETPGKLAVGNVFSTRELVCDYLGIKESELIPKLIHAINHPSAPKLVDASHAPVLEVTEEVDLHKLPIPIHAEKDGGAYFSSAIVMAIDPQYGRNCSFHRMMVIGKDRVVARILHRHLDEFITRVNASGQKELDIAIVVGAPINVLLSAATSVQIGTDELTIANSLAPLQTVKLPNGIEVPAEAEYVFEAKITSEMVDEGPFVDLTETYDVIRKQRVIRFTKMHHRKDPLWHVLLPGGLEHKILMGMPREPTIYNEVNKVAECTGVNITPGGCSWLHAVVGIKKKHEDDGKKAIDAAFAGHKSLKHVVIVDSDINIYDPSEVEWAIATRVQADKNVVIKSNEKGSSLDPSADPHTYATSKMGIDATKPLVAHGKNFEKARWMKVNPNDYL